MERIQEAIQLARQQRQQNAAVTGPAAQDRAEAAPGAAGQPFPPGIDYSRTRVTPVSEDTLRANRIVAGIPGHPQADVFRVLRTKVLQRMRQEGLRSLGITSPSKGSGKSTVAANLAIALAMEKNQTVLLVDLDLRKPSMHRCFGIEPERGLADYLLDGAEIPDLLVNPGIERLVLLPAGRAVTHSSELLATPRMMSLVDEIANRYASRIIVYDLPPVIGMDDALVLLPKIDANLLVVMEGADNSEQVKQSLRALRDGVQLGVIYNKAELMSERS